MKKVFAIAFAAVSLVACNNETDSTTADSMDTTNAATTNDMSGTTYTDTANTLNSTSSNAAYAPTEGDVTYRSNKVQVWRNGAWVESNEDVRLDNGVVVYRDGRVTRDGNEIRLEDGEVVTRTGNFFDRAGNTIEKGWDKTKEGAKDAGRAVGNAAEKVGKKVKNAVDNDKEQ